MLGQLKKMTSGQGQVVTQVGHVAYQEMCIDENNTLVKVTFLYLQMLTRAPLGLCISFAQLGVFEHPPLTRLPWHVDQNKRHCSNRYQK